MLNKFIEIDDVIVNKEIVNTKFTCDLEICKGACCTMESSYGAPLINYEIEDIIRNLEGIKKYLPEVHLKAIEKDGFWESKSDQLMTKSINNKECVFVFYENSIAKCSIEAAYNNGDSDFLKPLSCHLFPIRVDNFGGPALRFEEYSECKCALEKGVETGLSTMEFCKEALNRLLGEKWYNRLREYLGENK
jgi:hypothetical protein